MAELQLWRVEVERVWKAKGEAMVWAENRRQAAQMAEASVDLDRLDADEEPQFPFACRVVDLCAALESIKPGHEWLVMPDGSGTDDIDEFRSVLTPEMQFVLQQREWERNGQMTLETTQ